ncbi:MAG: hypothetical protein HLUCCA13_13445 [Halomonas sp. HL-48]|nr:hypothetical protein [Halomonas sp. HL-48]KPQ23423.1 MAG: hypothetical protein HLUCCA13_13445 [Halomonas sp. HL-48]
MKTDETFPVEKLKDSAGVMKCGIVMPISELDGCDEGHWQEVLAIIKDSILVSGFEGELVSLAADVGVIHRRIVQNLYENPVVVCDVSGKNPNVMFELGMRLAFDKPTIIIKDDVTNYSFDTASIEHLEYPRTLRFSQIIDFKKQLAEKIKATYEKSRQDADYSPFLKHFGSFKVAKIDETEVSAQEFLARQIEEIKSYFIQQDMFNKNMLQKMHAPLERYSSNKYSLIFEDGNKAKLYADKVVKMKGVADIDLEFIGSQSVVTLYFHINLAEQDIKKIIAESKYLLEKM